MSWRVVVISSRCKLDYKMEHLVIRTVDDEKRIYLGDISVLMIETTAVSLTAYLVSELVRNKIKTIFCDNLHNPLAEVMPFYGSYDTSGKLRQQIRWGEAIKANVWREIVRAKIINQSNVLGLIGRTERSKQVRSFADQIEPGDPTNREGHAAKVYFNSLFDDDFFRNSDDPRNAVLNYGYTIILSCFNREVAASGYLTQLGIWHNNSNNSFNLSSDLMESFRPIIDLFAYKSGFKILEKDEKLAIVNLLNSKVKIANSEQFINNAIGIYARCIFSAIEENDLSLIENWSYL